MSSPHASAKAIFLQALEMITVAERETYLDTECRGDAELRREVEELLRHQGEVEGFLESPPTAVVESAEQLRTIAPPIPSLAFLAPTSRADSMGRLGHYEILEIVGSGGMGIVLKGFDERLQRIVAIKAMNPVLAASGTGRQRFVREAQAAAAVNHDNVVDIYAVEEAAAVPYLVMEYIPGISLEDKLKQQGCLSLKEILRIGLQTADGLAAAHRQGLVHRDVKPANILLENGVERVKITDFGLARAANDVSVTQTGVIAGTPAYMSPEQAKGEMVDHRSDLFSLGSVLYALSTGQAPYRSSTSLGMLKQVCEEEAHPIRDLNADIPEWLCTVIEKLHAKLPTERFQSAAEVAEVLGNYLAHVQQSFPLPTFLANGPQRVGSAGASRSPSRRRWVLAAVGALAVLGVALSLTEASGVTAITSTVIRVLTPDGTLSVEVEDPNVKVTIEGDGGLIITGAGPQEVRVRPGKYTVRASKDGKALKEELVSILRGGTEIVRVQREPPATTAKVPLSPAASFVLLGRQDVAARKFDTLVEAVQGASDGDTIEVRGNGPFVIEPVTVSVPLVIRAGAGSRPVFTYDGAASHGLATTAPLVLEGLELIGADTSRLPGPANPAIVRVASSASLFVSHCRIVMLGSGRAVYGNPSHCEIRRCEFLRKQTANNQAVGGWSGGSGHRRMWNIARSRAISSQWTCPVMEVSSNHPPCDWHAIRLSAIGRSHSGAGAMASLGKHRWDWRWPTTSLPVKGF